MIVSSTSRRSRAAGELERDRVQGLALPLAPVEVRDRDAQLGGAGDLACDVGERGIGDVRLDGRVEGEPQVADAVRRRGSAAGPGSRCRCRPGGCSAGRRRRGRAARRGSGPSQARPGASAAGRRIRWAAVAARVTVTMPARAPVWVTTRSRRLLQEVRQREAAADRGADRVGRREVLVLGDELALGAVQVDRDDHREDDDRAAHDHRGRDVAVVARQPAGRGRGTGRARTPRRRRSAGRSSPT